MILYRSICKQEYDSLINDNKIIFKHPKKWGCNESILTEMFGFNKPTDEKTIKKRVEEFVKKYLERDKALTYYDAYTEIMIMFILSLYHYCQCWSEDKHINGNVNLPNSDKDYAILKANDNINQEIKIKLKNGLETTGRLRLVKVDYVDYGYSNSIEEIIKSFDLSERIFTKFISTLQNKHNYQKEHRLILMLDDYDFRMVGSLSNHPKNEITKEYNIDDLVNALISQSNRIYEQVQQKLSNIDYVEIDENKVFKGKIQKTIL